MTHSTDRHGQLLDENDATLKRAYGLMALDGDHVWAKFARQEIESLLRRIDLPPHSRVLDMGCGTGRHGLHLALAGHRVHGYDYVKELIDKGAAIAEARLDEIEEAGGEIRLATMDARDPEPMEGANLVLCLYDVVGSSPARDDARAVLDGLFRCCRPGGHVVVGCMSGTQLVRGIGASRLVRGEPDLRELEPVQAMQRCGEVFDFSRMAYDPATGTLYRRERFTKGDEVVLDALIRERRFLPVEIREMMTEAGFEGIEVYSVRAGKWDFDAPFDPDAPEVLYLARRPAEALRSVPRIRPADRTPGASKGFELQLIPASRIRPQHAAIVSRIFCAAPFGVNPRTSKPHILGPRRMYERLQRCSYLCLASSAGVPCGYMFGTEYDQEMLARIAWLDSICVMKGFRRRGIATAMLDLFSRGIGRFEWLGATSPNPITPLVLEKMRLGNIYLPGHPAPTEILDSLEFIKHRCEDLKDAEIDRAKMLIRTNFSVRLESEERIWAQPKDSRSESLREPPWWKFLENLPEDYESLLIIHRDSMATAVGEGPA